MANASPGSRSDSAIGRDHNEVRSIGNEYAALGRGDTEHERPVARRSAETVPLIDPVDEDAAQDDHHDGECRHRDEEPNRPEQASNHED
jgi:hypothetical protein